MKNNAKRFGWPVIVLHWLTLLTLVIIYACAELKYLPDSDDVTEFMKLTHYSLGLLLLLLVSVRLLVKATAMMPPRIVPELSRAMNFTAKSAHYLLYAFLIALPVLGWLLLSVKGKPVTFFDWFELPSLADKNPEQVKLVKYLHIYAGTAGYLLIGGHIGAAIYHHFVRRDNTLYRMLPFKFVTEAERRLWDAISRNQDTHLPNQRLFEDRLQQAIIKAKRDQTNLDVLSVVFKDFDFNAAAGIEKEISTALLSGIRESDTLAMLDDGSYKILLLDTKVDHDLDIVKAKLLEALGKAPKLKDIGLLETMVIKADYTLRHEAKPQH